MSDSETEAGDKGGKYVVEKGRFLFGGYADGGSGGGTYGGGGGGGRDGDGYGRLIKWEYTVAKITLGWETIDHLAYATGLEPHHPIMSTLGAHGGDLERDTESNYPCLISILFIQGRLD